MSNPKALCLNLMHADTEAEVISLLKKAGFWDDKKFWRNYGDDEFNWSSAGNQQSEPEKAIIEKLVNSIDTKLIAAARIKGFLPKTGDHPQAEGTPTTIVSACEAFFGDQLNNLEKLSRSITVAATGAKPPGRPCFTIVDDGEGQIPSDMPKTILSLHRGNKDKIKFVQGKFNMGGTGVLEFCGLDRNLQLVISKRNPKLLLKSQLSTEDENWSFTIIRRENPEGGKSSRFTYLAPQNTDKSPRKGNLPTFKSKTFPIFPDKNEAYFRDAEWGTLIKLYEYDSQRIRQNMMLKDSLMYRVRLLYPEPPLPIRFHECRNYRGHSGSFDTTMVGLIKTLYDDLDDAKRNNVTWFDKVEFFVNGEKFIATIFLFKSKEAAETYKRNEGVLYNYNGQCHKALTKDFFRRKSCGKQDYIWHSLLMLIDCSQISTRGHEKLFMANRDGLRDGDFKREVESKLEDIIREHQELKELASERRRKELSERPKASESMAKVLEKLIEKNPTLAALLGQGTRVKNPFKSESSAAGVAGFIGKRFPTKFHFKGLEPKEILKREAHINSKVRVAFITDAANDYFKREEEHGDFLLFQIFGNEKKPVPNYQSLRLHNGMAHMSLSLPEEAKEGEKLIFEAEISDPSQTEPFKNRFLLNIKKEQVIKSGPPPKKKHTGDDKGNEKGLTKGENEKIKDSFLDIPDPHPVFEKDWKKHEPNFDKFTAMVIKEQPESKEGEEKYDYFINMDNVFLQQYLKGNPKKSGTLKLRFSIGMALVALSLLHQDQLKNKGVGLKGTDYDKTDVRDTVGGVTSALAPFLIPMIESVSLLEEDEQYLSSSAGEVA